MEVRDAQADVRSAYRGGFAGPLVSSLIWSAAAAAYEWASPGVGISILFLGGILIFPISTLVLKIPRSPAALPKGHPSNALAIQSAFTVPLGLLVAIALGSFQSDLFFPASLIIVGAHYLTFISLYGMWLYGALAGVLVAIGAASMFWLPGLRGLSGWIGALVLLTFALPLYFTYRASGAHVSEATAPSPA